jgi:hypothetical protein
VARLLDATEEDERLGRPTLREEALRDVVFGVGAVARNIERVSHTPPGIARLRKEH